MDRALAILTALFWVWFLYGAHRLMTRARRKDEQAVDEWLRQQHREELP